MDEDNRSGVKWEPYVWRGALGGACGAAVEVLVGGAYVWATFGVNYLRHMLVIVVISALISGVLIGIAVGFIIFKVTTRSRKQPSALSRVIIGVGCVLAYAMLVRLAGSGTLRLAFDFGYAAVFGGLAGLLARSRTPSPSTAVVAGRP